uniref:JmjC domain-containing protein n=1 Tax=Plectus sambesii TaxID=2011161 RepID=A0A914UIR9_9BILA
MRQDRTAVICFYACSFLSLHLASCVSHVGKVILQDAVRLTADRCLVLLVEPEPAPNRPVVELERAELVERVVATAFASDDGIAYGRVELSRLDGEKYVRLEFEDGQRPKEGDVIALEKRVPDRSCLLTNHLKHVVLLGAVLHASSIDENLIVSFVNDRCGAFFTPDGSLSIAGLHRHAILSELTNVYAYPNSVTMAELVDKCSSDLSCFFNGKCAHQCLPSTEEETCGREWENASKYVEDASATLSSKSKRNERGRVALPECEVLETPPSRQRFLLEYVAKSRPVVIRNAINHWPALSQWTNDAFRARFGANDTHVKLTPGGEFEGVEPISLWNASRFQIPPEVKAALRFTDLVMVRPEGIDMTVAQFLDLIEHVSKNSSFVSAYLEYAPIRQHLKGLEKDVPALSFAADLNLDMLNIWLSDGNTLGKLHMDQYDNLLCQLSGRKQLILFDPANNEQLYEGHILEAMLRYHNGTFHRDRLMRSTALTMSPVDITKPDFQKFPLFAGARPMRCVIEKGDVLYLPSFWWHEVQSYPNMTEGRNLAVNFWYEPFLTKQFPCEECKLDVNLNYRHLL